MIQRVTLTTEIFFINFNPDAESAGEVADIS